MHIAITSPPTEAKLMNNYGILPNWKESEFFNIRISL